MKPAPLAGETRISLTQVVKIGTELRTRLERVAQEEGRDATSLAKLVLLRRLRSARPSCEAAADRADASAAA